MSRTIARIDFRGCSPDALGTLPLRQGGVLTDELLQEVRRQLGPRLRIQLHPSPVDPNAVDVVVFDPAIPPRRIRIEGAVQGMLVEKVLPAGPPAAAGVVRLSVVVARDGGVIEVTPISGPDSLRQPAADAVRQWKYRPVLLNGRPVEVQTAVEVSFA